VRFPARLVLAGLVLGTISVGSGTVYALSAGVEDAAIAVPDLSTAPAPEALPPAAPTVTGAQLAALAAVPARERATAIVAERAAAEAAERARRAAAEQQERSREERIREAVRKACAQGTLRGVICRSG
jgi:conjugal transfer/entry exclusion protein